MVDTKNPQYTFLKRNTYYFSRLVPLDLRHHYTCDRIVQSLKTSSIIRARVLSKNLGSKLDEYWFALRIKDLAPPGENFLAAQDHTSSNCPLIEECLDQYLSVKGRGKTGRFHATAKRNIKYLTDCLGNRPLDSYKSSDAASLRDWLLDNGLSSGSVLRIVGGIKAVINFSSTENGYDFRNPFAGLYLPTATPKKRHSITKENIIKIQSSCKNLDDDIRWLVALISDTGMRLSEAAGLVQTDLKTDNPTPHVVVQLHPHRRLKTLASSRVIPLVGCSLWAALRIKTQQSTYCFPRYSNVKECNSNSASASINKWIKTIANNQAVVHGLRHSFRDRLREVEAPTDMIDQLGGWSMRSVGQGYGDGYNLEAIQKWMLKISIRQELY